MSPTYDTEVAVVGGGPAGMVAARDVARLGLRVVLLEESAHLGGQYFKPRKAAVQRMHGDHRPGGRRLAREVFESGVEVSTSSLVWGVDDDQHTLLADLGERGISEFRAASVILATGARERSIPFPGWHLPGVMTAGCALHLAAADCVRPGERMVVGGSGPFLLPVACALLDVGVEVGAIYESAYPYRPRAESWRLAEHPLAIRELTGYRLKLRRAGVPVMQGHRILEARPHGVTGRVNEVAVVDSHGNERRERVDALAVSYGFQPNTELADLMGCGSRVDPTSWDRVLVTDAYGRSTQPGVALAGEVAGIGGAQNAQVQGALAAYGVGQDHGVIAADSSRSRNLLRRQRKLARFQRIVASQFPIQTEIARSIPAETIVCRCEGVTAEDVAVSAQDGNTDLNAMKGISRAGMGICQGRQCGYAVAELLQANRKVSGGELGVATQLFTARIPLKPVGLGAIRSYWEERLS